MSSRFNYYYQEENINKRVIEYEYEREFIIISSLFLSSLVVFVVVVVVVVVVLLKRPRSIFNFNYILNFNQWVAI